MGSIFFRIFYMHYNDKNSDVERRIEMITIMTIAAIFLISYKLVIGLFKIAMEGL